MSTLWLSEGLSHITECEFWSKTWLNRWVFQLSLVRNSSNEWYSIMMTIQWPIRLPESWPTGDSTSPDGPLVLWFGAIVCSRHDYYIAGSNPIPTMSICSSLGFKLVANAIGVKFKLEVIPEEFSFVKWLLCNKCSIRTGKDSNLHISFDSAKFLQIENIVSNSMLPTERSQDRSLTELKGHGYKLSIKSFVSLRLLHY